MKLMHFKWLNIITPKTPTEIAVGSSQNNKKVSGGNQIIY